MKSAVTTYYFPRIATTPERPPMGGVIDQAAYGTRIAMNQIYHRTDTVGPGAPILNLVQHPILAIQL
jgi:hypothetical protein